MYIVNITRDRRYLALDTVFGLLVLSLVFEKGLAAASICFSYGKDDNKVDNFLTFDIFANPMLLRARNRSRSRGNPQIPQPLKKENEKKKNATKKRTKERKHASLDFNAILGCF